jgi:hypothetical protein
LIPLINKGEIGVRGQIPPWARKGMIVKNIIENGKILRLSFLPLLMNKKGQSEILVHDRGDRKFLAAWCA